MLCVENLTSSHNNVPEVMVEIQSPVLLAPQHPSFPTITFSLCCWGMSAICYLFGSYVELVPLAGVRC